MKNLKGNIYNFTKFERLQQAATSDDPKAQVPLMIDVIGVIITVQEVGQI